MPHKVQVSVQVQDLLVLAQQVAFQLLDHLPIPHQQLILILDVQLLILYCLLQNQLCVLFRHGFDLLPYVHHLLPQPLYLIDHLQGLWWGLSRGEYLVPLCSRSEVEPGGVDGLLDLGEWRGE